ncbi:hypothetical protein TD95_001247 [Thielaviopsis punctulata]|uniref:Non-structural maintenance of chromosomes element 1 homolog n=1 Tax=Thielaviopsis punctulata TaxID=72032 RepID=A0A0F4ZCT0_9PEZI|nr:hypothetical protein TD95_001247 [Thielaviopsis punctulata]
MPVDFEQGPWLLPAFIQALMSRGSFTEKDAKIIIGELLAASDLSYEPEDLQEVLENLVSVARQNLSRLDYDVRIALDQTSGERVYCFVNTVSDLATQLATTYNSDELAFIRRLLVAMFATYNTQRMEVMALTKQQCLRLGRAPNSTQASLDEDENEPPQSQVAHRSITHGDVNRIMDELVAMGWMAHSDQGFYTLATRGLSELAPWLVNTFNDGDQVTWQRIKNCIACREILTQGQRCANVDCLVRLHDRCAVTMFASHREKKCSICKMPWTGKNYVGERAITEGRLYQQSRGMRGRQSNVADQAFEEQNGRMDDGEDEGQEEEPEEDEEESE